MEILRTSIGGVTYRGRTFKNITSQLIILTLETSNQKTGRGWPKSRLH